VSTRFGHIERFLLKRTMARWAAAAQSASTAELALLREQRQTARQLRGSLNNLLHVAEGRLALPRIGSNVFPKPTGTRWSWRPQLWRGRVAPKAIVGVTSGQDIGPSVKLFHDCPLEELTARQIRNTREEDLAAFGLGLEVFGFDGSFLSLAVDLPLEATDGLRKRDIIQAHLLMERERPMAIFARLNIKCGPNTSQLLQELPAGQQDVTADFDLAYADIAENRIDALWLDLIIDQPAMNRLQIRDLTFCRYPRAEI